MIEVEEALQLIESTEINFRVIEISTSESLGYILAQDVVSTMNMPPFKQSAMDGYAICGFSDTFDVIGEIKAGDTNQYEINVGEAYRIFTGAPVPDNATAVIMQEKVNRIDDSIAILDDIIESKNIRPIGEQVKENDLLLEKGHQLTPSSIGILYSLGVEFINVFQKPKITLLVTGDELKSVGEELKFGEIYESNSITIKTAALQTGFNISEIINVNDDFESIKFEIKNAINNSDVVILSGGISVGDYDFVKQSLLDNKVKEVFYKVNQKPGKPLFFGVKDSKCVFALPGNPAAALTCFYMYVYPLLNKISGKGFKQLDQLKLKLDKKYIKIGDRAQFLKGYYEVDEVTILDGQASSMLWSYAKANCLIYIPSDVNELNTNDEVLIYHLPQN